MACKSAVGWYSPHTQPPYGLPRVMKRWDYLASKEAGEYIKKLESLGFFKYVHHVSIDDTPARVMPEATKIILRKRRAMKRILKAYGFLADQFIPQEYTRKGWEWGPDDDRLWAEENQKAFKAKKIKKKKSTRRNTDNDHLRPTAAL